MMAEQAIIVRENPASASGLPPPPPFNARGRALAATFAITVPEANSVHAWFRRAEIMSVSFLAVRCGAGSAFRRYTAPHGPAATTRFRAGRRVGSAVRSVPIGAGWARRQAYAFFRFRGIPDNAETRPRMLAVAKARLTVCPPAFRFRSRRSGSALPGIAACGRELRQCPLMLEWRGIIVYTPGAVREGRGDWWGMGNVRVRLSGIRCRPVRRDDGPCPGGRCVMAARHDAQRSSEEAELPLRAPSTVMRAEDERSGSDAERFSPVARERLHVHLQSPRISIAARNRLGFGDDLERILHGGAAARRRG